MKNSTTFFRVFCSTPSVFRGFYMVFFVIYITSSSLAQRVEKDTTSFNKWEVSVDLKPLFRREEPYSVLFKRYLTPKKAIRLGLGTVNFSKDRLGDKELLEYSGRVADAASTLIYSQNIEGGDYNKSEMSISIGYTYFIKKSRLSIYSNTDLMLQNRNNNYEYFGRASRVLSGKDSIFTGYDPSWKLSEKSKIYSLRQILGLTYSFNKNISVGTEIAVSLSYIDYDIKKIDKPYPNEIRERAFFNQSKSYNVGFVPFLSLFLNYHFNFKNSLI